MKAHSLRKRFACFAATFTLSLLAVSATSAQTTAFTYQGKLTEAGNPANGNYDLQFALFDNVSGGTQIGSTLTRSSTGVSNGVFTVQLDFSVNPFSGANRFLEIAVRPSAVGSFTTLSPRQQISSTPYAIRTLNAGAADSLSSACVACVQDSQINSVSGSKVSGTIPVASVPVGSGNYIQNSSSPQSSSNFNISGNGSIGGSLNLNGAFPNGLFLSNGTANLRGTIVGSSVLFGTTTNHPLKLFSSDGANNGTLTLDTTGNVGIDAVSPETKLTVHTFGSDYGITHTNGSIRLTTFLGGNGNGGYFGTRSNHPLYFFTNDSGPLMTVSTAGNVGIGTTAPSAKLSVQGEGANGVGIALTGHATQSVGKGGWVKAMVEVYVFNPPGQQIGRCFNAFGLGAAVTTPPCGFTLNSPQVGDWQITFPFNLDQSFAVLSMPIVTDLPNSRVVVGGVNVGGANTAFAKFYYSTGQSTNPSTFTVVIF